MAISMCVLNYIGGETYFCVGVVGRLETQVLEAHVGEEVTEEALETYVVSVEGIAYM